jgi:cell division septal protein FtsQ
MKRIFVLLLVVATLGATGWIFWNSSALELRRIEVSGNLHIPKEELAAVTGLSAGTRLLDIKTSDVARRVETLPWVLDARVERIIPSKLRISVTERTPVAQVALSGRNYFVDRQGVVLSEGSGLELAIGGLPLKTLTVGQQISLRQFREALAVLDSLEESIRSRVDSMEARSVDRITLNLNDGTTVLFGAAERVGDKNYALTAILAEAAKEGSKLASIDVRVPDRPAVRTA